MPGISVLCVDPDQTARDALTETVETDLADLHPTVYTCESIDDAESVVETDEIDCLVTEYDLRDGTGVEFARRLRSVSPDVSVILFTSHPHDTIDTGEGDPVVVEFVDKAAEAAFTRVTSLIELTVTFGSQVSYPLPDREAERLAALDAYDFESPGLVRSFDHVTELAVQHFEVGSASINIIEEHEQRLLACQGMDAGAGSTSRDGSICTFTIVSNDPVMTVEDVREDARFEGHYEGFEALGIRSYMGATVETPSGLPIGTLCVYDDEPREFSQHDREYIQTLAALVVDLLTAYTQLDGEVTAVAGHAAEETDDSAEADDSDDSAAPEDSAVPDDLSAAEEAFR